MAKTVKSKKARTQPDTKWEPHCAACGFAHRVKDNKFEARFKSSAITIKP
jgi:hypothetical protein